MILLSKAAILNSSFFCFNTTITKAYFFKYLQSIMFNFCLV
jgi:hypothetical protein